MFLNNSGFLSSASSNGTSKSSSASKSTAARTMQPLFEFGNGKGEKFSPLFAAPAPSANSPLSPQCTEARRQEEERKARLLFRNGLPIKMCSNCGTTSTPSWRRCVEGKNLLCNACGLYAKLHNKSRPFVVSTDGTVKVQRQGANEATICLNCSTTETPLWRRGLNGESLCNACGLYLKQHAKNREIKRFNELSGQMPEVAAIERNNSQIVNISGLERNNSHSGNIASIDISALESLANELYAPVGGNFGAKKSGFGGGGGGGSNDDKELLEKLQYLEDAAAFLLSSCESANGGNVVNKL